MRLQNSIMQQPVALLLATIATILIYMLAFGNFGKPSAHIEVRVSDTRVTIPIHKKSKPFHNEDNNKAAATVISEEEEEEDYDYGEEKEYQEEQYDYEEENKAVKDFSLDKEEEEQEDNDDGAVHQEESTDDDDDDGADLAVAEYTPGKGVGCVTCSQLSQILAEGQDMRNAPSCEWGQDIVLVAKTPSCITKTAIDHLEHYLKPRRFHVITTDDNKCPYYQAMSPRVVCYNENNLWQHMNYSILKQLFQKYHPDSKERWARRIGWYLQQLLKLGAADYLGDQLTEHYMVWDADMVMLAPVYPTCYDEASGEVRVVLELGGWRAPGYLATYENMFGEAMKHPHVGSFVGHRMVAKKRLMLKLLEEMKGDDDSDSDEGGEGEEISWQENVVTHVSEEYIHTGFSEYATYGSWMMKKHANEAFIKPRVTWIRHLDWKVPNTDPCCPKEEDFTAFSKAYNYTVSYVGVELGHTDDPLYGDVYKACNSHDPKYEIAYGLDDPHKEV